MRGDGARSSCDLRQLGGFAQEWNVEMHMLRECRFDFEGHRVAAYRGGSPGRLPLLLMHGLGPGASIASAFGTIVPFLTTHFQVHAMDWIGFGRSQRKHERPYFDFSFWVRQAQAFIASIPPGPIGVFGHSMSGAVALKLAATERRVVSVITTGTVGTAFEVNEHLRRLWTYPRSPEELGRGLASLVHDPSLIEEAELERRWAVLSSDDYGSYFTEMFRDPQRLADSWVVPRDELSRIRVPYTLVHGRDDQACPAEHTSIPLSKQIAHSDLVLLSRCGHAPSAEHPQKVCAAVRSAFCEVVPFQ